MRLAKICVTRPADGEVQLKSGPVLEFDYPSQFPPVLVVFGDFIDPEFAFLQRIAQPNWFVVDADAAKQDLKGDARKTFMSTCLKKAS